MTIQDSFGISFEFWFGGVVVQDTTCGDLIVNGQYVLTIY